MTDRYGFLCLFLGLACALPMTLADDGKKETTNKPAESGAKDEVKFNAKCPVSGADAKKEQAAKYKDKEVYFCCEKCKAKFEAGHAEFAAKANHQLVQTKQYRQTVCPISGSKVNKEQSSKVAGVKVAFCCDKCKGKLDAATKEEQLAMVFADEVFAKSFAVKKADSGKGKKKAADSEAK